MTFRSLALGMLFLSCTGSARADVRLATFVHQGTGIVSPAGGDPSWMASIGFSAPNTLFNGTLESVLISLLDVAQGNSYELAGDFETFEILFTDAASQAAYIGFNVPNGGTGDFDSTNEQALLIGAYGKAPGVSPPDFAGFDLSRVVVTPTSFQMSVNGAFTVVNEFDVYGRPVPEPAALALGVFAVVGIIWRRIRRGIAAI